MRQTWRLLLAALVVSLSACATTGTSTEALQGGDDRPDTLAETFVKLGIGYMQQGQRELALGKLQRALELDPNLPSAHNAIAILYERLGQTELASRHYQRAVSLGPQDSNAHNNYGTFLCNRNELDRAEEQFLLALKNPLYATPELAYENAGQCALRKPDLAKAETYFRSALQLNPKLASSLYQMSVINHERGDYLPARAYLQRYTEVASHTPQSLWLGIKIERALGDKNAVSSYALLLKSNFPDSDEARLLQESEGTARAKPRSSLKKHDDT